MKNIFTAFLLLLSGVAFSQIDNTPYPINGRQGTSTYSSSRKSQFIKGQKPLYIIFSHNQAFYQGDTILKVIPPSSITSVKVIKDSISLKKYGPSAKFGVVEIYIDDEKAPEVYKILKP